jgi:hypothetical protein
VKFVADMAVERRKPDYVLTTITTPEKCAASFVQGVIDFSIGPLVTILKLALTPKGQKPREDMPLVCV